MSLFGKISESFNAIVKNSYQSDDNFNQEEYDSPFNNTGNEFIGENFEVHAYNWNEDVEQPYNFKCGVIEISWYKYLGRGTTINGFYTKDEIVEMYNICLDEIRKMDGDKYEAFC